MERIGRILMGMIGVMLLMAAKPAMGSAEGRVTRSEVEGTESTEGKEGSHVVDIPDDFDDLNLDEKPEFLRVLEREPLGFDPDAWLDTALMYHFVRARAPRFTELTDDDYREVAEELGVEVAAIKAVVEIETGNKHQGFWTDGKPLINFDLSMFRQFAGRLGVSLKDAHKRYPLIFEAPNVRKYGSYQGGQQARLDAAMELDKELAVKSTFWGMFQIGGFNWKKCGAESMDDFVARMSRSERDQLELFAAFIKNNGMLDAIKQKNWLKFALKYNGPKAKSRGYHTRLARAYKKYKD